MTKAVLEAESEGATKRSGSPRSVPRFGGPGKPARLADGAARSARLRQGGGTDRSGDRARVSSCSVGCDSPQEEPNFALRLTVSLMQVCYSGRE